MKTYYKLYNPEGEYVGSAHDAKDASAFVARLGDGATIRHGHTFVVWREGFVVWREGSEDQLAAESYDHARPKLESWCAHPRWRGRLRPADRDGAGADRDGAANHRPLIRQCALSSATHAQVTDRDDAVAIAAQFRAWLTYPGGETPYSRLWTVCAEAYEARAEEVPEEEEIVLRPCECDACGGTGIEP
jgi:hypothetical protein